MSRFIAIIFLLIPNSVLACSFSPSFESVPFLVKPSYGKSVVPKPPVLEVASISRGYDDGNGGSCSDFGVIELKVLTDEVGYEITVNQPNEYKKIIPEGLYGAVKDGSNFYIRFVWLEDLTKKQERISIMLDVRAMSKNGQLSEQVQIKVEN